jgi:hypothetical protein
MQVVEFSPCQGSVASIIAMIWLPNSVFWHSQQNRRQVTAEVYPRAHRQTRSYAFVVKGGRQQSDTSHPDGILANHKFWRGTGDP